MNNGQRERRASGELTTLMQVMQLNPSCWNQHSVEAILDDLEVLGAPEIPETILFRTQRVQRELILPLADIVATQSKTITVERRRFSEREKNFKRALASLEAEKSKAIQLYQEEADQLAKHSQFCDMLLGDLDEMAKTLDITRLEKKKAEGKLAELEADKEQSEKRLAQLEAEVQRLTLEQEELIQKLATQEPTGDASGVAPKLCENCQADMDVKLEKRQGTLAVSDNPTVSSSHAADEKGYPRATSATAQEATPTAAGLDDGNTSGETENSIHEVLIQKLATQEPTGDASGVAPKLCENCQADMDVKLEKRQGTVAVSDNLTDSSSHAADEEGYPRATSATAQEAIPTAAGLDDHNTSGETENSIHGASTTDQDTLGIAAPATANEAVGTVSRLHFDKTSGDTYVLSSFQPHGYYSMESPDEKVSVLEQVGIVVLEEGTTSIQIILDSGLSSAPRAVQHFCKGLCNRTVIGISAAILSVVKHSPLGFAFQMY